MKKIELKEGMGCACKIDSSKLHEILATIPKKENKNLLVGYDTADDGAVYQIDEEKAVIQTLDFFTPICDDPYTFGQIAAANALSDVYAMGGEVLSALNIVCFPKDDDYKILEEILKGGAAMVHEAGACLVGGHSINDSSIKYGLSVTGIVKINKILKNSDAKVGDVIILTKPLGVGIINTASRIEYATDEAFQKALDSMTYLNKYAMDILKKYELHGCTDVTGYGLCGHGIELAKGSGVTLLMDKDKIHYIDEAFEYAKDFISNAALQKNKNNFECFVDCEVLSYAQKEIIFDAQTSGGLMVTLSEKDALIVIKELNKLKIKSKIIGKVVEQEEKAIVFKGE